MELAHFIIENLTLDDLVLSLHTGPCYNIHMKRDLDNLHVSHVIEAYMSIVEPLQGLGDRNSLKEFYLYWAMLSRSRGGRRRVRLYGKVLSGGVKISRKEREPYHPLRYLWNGRNPIDQ